MIYLKEILWIERMIEEHMSRFFQDFETIPYDENTDDSSRETIEPPPSEKSRPDQREKYTTIHIEIRRIVKNIRVEQKRGVISFYLFKIPENQK